MNDITSTKKSSRVHVIHSLEEIEVDTRVRGIAAMSEDEARALTTQIQRTTVRLWMLVTEAHDRKAHIALGFETWADYVKAELNMSESRSYQFLDTGHVMKALAAAGVDIEAIAPPPTRVVARVKDRLTDVRKSAEAALKKGESVDAAIRGLAREPKGRGQPNGGESSAAVSSPAPVATPRQSTEGQVPCPSCAGTGKVSKAAAERILDLIRKYGKNGK